MVIDQVSPDRYEDLSPALGWGACALPAELYPGDLACVHQVPASAIHAQSSSAFLQESPLSWAAPQTTPPVYTATHNPAFAGDDPSFQALVENEDAKETQDKDKDASDNSAEPLGHRAA